MYCKISIAQFSFTSCNIMQLLIMNFYINSSIWHQYIILFAGTHIVIMIVRWQYKSIFCIFDMLIFLRPRSWKFMCRTHHNVFERRRRFRTKSFYLNQFQRFEDNNVFPHQEISVITTITTLVLNFHICNNNLLYKNCNNRLL